MSDSQQAAWPEFEDGSEEAKTVRPENLILSRQAFEMIRRVTQNDPRLMASRSGLQSLFPGLMVK